MGDIKEAHNLVRGDRIDVSAAMDAALGDSDERFYWDGIEIDAEIDDATVEGVTTALQCTTVYTCVGAFSVPADFPLRIVAYGNGFIEW